MKSLSHAEEFNAPAGAVWKLLLDWAALIDWMPDGYIRSCTWMAMPAAGRVPFATSSRARVLPYQKGRCADELSGARFPGTLPWGLLSYRASGKLDVLPEQRCRLTWSSTLEMPQSGIEADRVAGLLEKSYAKMFLGIRRRVEAE
jgi:hypothetical protein